MNDNTEERKTGLINNSSTPARENYYDKKIGKGFVVKNRYRIEKKIGEGGFGIVFQAFDLILKKKVALKFLDPGLLEDKKNFPRVRREINISQKIADERIIRIFSLEEWKELHFLVMEMAPGESLKEYFKKKGRIEWIEFKDIFLQILEGVKVLHENSIIHRDLKPSNIMIDTGGKIKILDFGLSKEITDMEKTASTGEVVGSPQYMSPEQILGKDIDFQSDIYQLGLILYTAISGAHPFGDSNTLEMFWKHLYEKQPKVSSKGIKIPNLIEYIVEKSMEKKRNQRFKNIAEILELFKTGRVSIFKRAVRKVNSRPVRNFLIISFLLALMVSGYYEIIGSQTLFSVESSGSILRAKNRFGFKTWEKDFSPLNISASYITQVSLLDKIKYLKKDPGNKAVLVFLEHPKNKVSSPDVSISSTKFDSRVIILNTAGEEEKSGSLKEFSGIDSYGFSAQYRLIDFRRIDIDGDSKKETIAQVNQSLGVFPSAFLLIKGVKFYSFSNPGYIINYWGIDADKQYSSFLLFGLNNIISHLCFIAEVKFSPGSYSEQIFSIPNSQDSVHKNFTGFLYFLPKASSVIEATWREKGEVKLFNKDTSEVLTLSKDYKLIVKSVGKTRVYQDNFESCQNIYRYINQYYQEKKIRRANGKAYGIIQKAIELKIENSYLKSALFYFKGDLEVSMGDLKKGENTLKQSVALYPFNNDSLQRLAEIEFLRNKPLLAIQKLGEGPTITRFSGIPHGYYIFKMYCYLQMGDFFKAGEAISNYSESRGSGSALYKSVYHLLKGDYHETLKILKKYENKRVSPFTLAEFRLHYARVLLLTEQNLKRAKFYFDDISLYSLGSSHLTNVSKGYLLALNGKKNDALKVLKPAFEKLIEHSTGDLITKFWFFYDAYIYARTMEILGDKKEATRGYILCIEANPYTELTARSKNALRKRGWCAQTVK